MLTGLFRSATELIPQIPPSTGLIWTTGQIQLSSGKPEQIESLLDGYAKSMTAFFHCASKNRFLTISNHGLGGSRSDDSRLARTTTADFGRRGKAPGQPNRANRLTARPGLVFETKDLEDTIKRLTEKTVRRGWGPTGMVSDPSPSFGVAHRTDV